MRPIASGARQQRKAKNRLSPTFVICARAATAHISIQRVFVSCAFVCCVSRCKSRSFRLVFFCFATKIHRSWIIHSSHRPIKPHCHLHQYGHCAFANQKVSIGKSLLLMSASRPPAFAFSHLFRNSNKFLDYQQSPMVNHSSRLHSDPGCLPSSVTMASYPSMAPNK